MLISIDSILLLLRSINYQVKIDNDFLHVKELFYKENKLNDIKINDINCDEVNLSDYVGKKTIITFWNTWCPYCKELLPTIEEIHLNNPDIEVITVNVKESEEVVQEFIRSNNYTFKVIMDIDADLATIYEVIGVPTTIIIGEDDYIVDIVLGADIIDKLVFK